MNPQLRRFATQDEILVAIRDRLRAVCPGCGADKHCFISDQPLPDQSLFPTVSHFVTVAASSGVFDQSLFTGGGNRTLSEDLTIVITPCIQMNLDRLPSGEQRLIHQSRGLSIWKQNILTSLLLGDAANPSSRAWEPTVYEDSGQQRPLLRSQLRPITCSEVADLPEGMGWCGLHLSFSCSFDWKLELRTA